MSHWEYKTEQNHQESRGAQIDLLIDREDDSITLCEIKYSSEPFVIDKSYAKILMNKLEVFEQQQKTQKQVFLALITTVNPKKNTWSDELINNTVVLTDLFT